MATKRFIVFFLGVILCSSLRAEVTIEQWRTTSDTAVFFVKTEGLPLVDVRVMFDAGSARDPGEEKLGLASLTAQMLETGAGAFNADEIAAQFERVGAVFSTGVSVDMVWLDLRSLSTLELLNPALGTLGLLLTQPTFNSGDFDREKNRVLTVLKQREESPGALAKLSFYKALYGQHPYAHPSLGEITTVSKIELDHVKAFHQKWYVSENATIVIVGDVTQDHARKIAEQLIAKINHGDKAPELPAVTTQPGQNIHINYPSKQTHVLSGLLGIDRNDVDYFPLVVGNHILGGASLVSILFEEVREKRGLAYSAYSYFSPMARKGPFIMGAQTRNDQLSEALTVMHKTLEDFVLRGPSDAELTAAKKNITGGFAMRFDTNKELLKYISVIAFHHLPLNYLTLYPEKVLAVTRAKIKEAFERRIVPEGLTTVTVGNKVSENGK